jgi:predicted nucleotidyltransferase
MTVTEADIRWLVTRITALHDTDRIYLFGSHVRGEDHGASDIDLLIIGPSRIPRRHRGKNVAAALRSFSSKFDLLFFTAEELDEELAQPLSFLSSVLRNSRLIYDRRDEPPLRIGPPS